MQSSTQNKEVPPIKVFRAQRQLDRLQKSLDEVNKAIASIEQLSKSLEAPILASINSVCKMDVRVYHTAEITVALGSDYFVTVTKDKALEIAKLRQKIIKDKINQIKPALEAYNKTKTAKLTPQELPKKSHDKILLEQNEAGEDVFEIIEYPDEEEQVSETKPVSKTVPKEPQQPIPAVQPVPPAQPVQSATPEVPPPQQPEVAPPKKLSKFKQERLQQKK